MTKYEITIKRTTTEKKKVTNKWGVIGTEEVERDSQYCSRAGEPLTRVAEVYGYLPPCEDDVSETETIYNQILPDIDMKALVSVLNKI